MPDNDSISYFSSLGFARTGQVRVTPSNKTELPSLPAANSVSATSESDIDPNADTANKALRADTFVLSKQAEALSADDLRLIQKLAQRDRQVRAHEAAHLGAAGRFARSGANFTFQRGPNGVSYAIGGEVSLDTSTPSDPQVALSKAEIIRRAALAPIDPSSQDRIVAGQATQMAVQARAAITSERTEEAAEALGAREEGGDETQATDESGSDAGAVTTQQTQGEIQEYLDNSSVENTQENENRVPLLNAEA
jgi:hypothetical protein